MDRLDGRRSGGGNPLARALRNQSLWLVITYIGLLLLIARGYE